MKEITGQLKIFLDEKFVNKMNEPSTKLSQISQTFLKHLFKLMTQAEAQFKNTQMKRENIVRDNQSHTYIPEQIRSEIDKMNKFKTVFSFLIDKREFRVSMVYSNQNVISNANLALYIKRIYMWLYIANTFASKNCSQTMDIILYFTQQKKLLPSVKNVFIKQEHANTAFTTSCQKTTEINIYREEEWFKVLIHETFHCMGLDFSDINNETNKKMILDIFPVKSDVNLFETYCEMWAEILNVMFISYYSTKQNENLDDFTQKMLLKTQKMLYYERVFSLFQCVKVLDYFDLKYNDLHEKTKLAQDLRTSKYKEDTNILAYYVLKCIFMFYSNEFIEWNVHNNKSSLQINKGSATIQSYFMFIREHFKMPEFVKSMDIFEKWFSKQHKKTIINQTMRMTLFEI